MTLLHQAAQKAAEAPAVLEVGFKYANGVHTPTLLLAFRGWDERDAFVSALQQQPEPEASTCDEHGLAMPCEACAAVASYRASRRAPPALQHQEVPREPVARPSMSMYASAADYSAAMDGWIAATRQCPACKGKFGVDGQACDLCNATGRVPSTTRQQEVGSGWQPIETAPKERRGPLESPPRVLLYWPCSFGGREQIETGYWNEDSYAKKPRPYWRGDRERIFGITAYREYSPTHWQPLPAAPSTPEKGEKDDATCPAHGGRYHWTQDCPECTKDARARGMSMDDYYSHVRPTLRTLGVDASGEGQR